MNIENDHNALIIAEIERIYNGPYKQNEGATGFSGPSVTHGIKVGKCIYSVDLIKDQNFNVKVEKIIKIGPLKEIRKEKLEKLNFFNTIN